MFWLPIAANRQSLLPWVDVVTSAQAFRTFAVAVVAIKGEEVPRIDTVFVSPFAHDPWKNAAWIDEGGVAPPVALGKLDLFGSRRSRSTIETARLIR